MVIRAAGASHRKEAIRDGTPLVSRLRAVSVAPLGRSGGGADRHRARHARGALAEIKTRAIAGVEARAKLARVINDTVFSFGELAFQEFETSKYLTGILENNGFKVERGVVGLPTGWVARWGSGKPVIAVGSDIDCIPKASQKPGVAITSP
jgi:metal-dependent amidase/aminoacylase/carboxypeptidase family protein